MSFEPKYFIKALTLKAINAIPVSSTVIGSPRRILKVAELNFKESFCEYVPVIKPELISEKLPGTIDKEVFFKYIDLTNRIQPEQFILKLTNARVWGRNGAIITADDIFISDVSQEFGPAKFDSLKHSIFRRIKLKKPVEIDGSVAVIASPGGNVYAHWFCDIMPRLMLLKKHCILENVNKIIMSFSRLDFQLETLERLGLKEERIINCIDETEFHLKARTLFVPSYPNEHGTVNKWASDEIKSIFLNDYHNFSQKKNRIFITRSKAIGRRMINEEEVFNFLKKEYGFVKMYAEDYKTIEKARIFNDAECIVAPHGGGLTNIIFCSPGCRIVDIFPPGDFTTYFWSLANANHLEYYYFFGNGELPTKENYITDRNSDIEVDLSKFKPLFELLKLKKIK